MTRPREKKRKRTEVLNRQDEEHPGSHRAGDELQGKILMKIELLLTIEVLPTPQFTTNSNLPTY